MAKYGKKQRDSVWEQIALGRCGLRPGPVPEDPRCKAVIADVPDRMPHEGITPSVQTAVLRDNEVVTFCWTRH